MKFIFAPFLAIKFVVMFLLGILLLIVSPGFRALVKKKGVRRGTDEPVATGENVVAVLNTNGHKEVIGG